jgi:hypothetical protein
MIELAILCLQHRWIAFVNDPGSFQDRADRVVTPLLVSQSRIRPELGAAVLMT